MGILPAGLPKMSDRSRLNALPVNAYILQLMNDLAKLL